jgi:hypothetical protein
MSAQPITAAPAFRQVDALTGRIAELERQHQVDEQRVTDAEAQRDEWSTKCGEAIAQRDQARDELATAKAVGSRRGW